jgi:hypothetical protein
MAVDHRMVKGKERLNYTCENAGYHTNTNKGFPHGPYSKTLGSRFEEPLATRNDYTLWLEHVIEIRNGRGWYWLMWYRDGKPTIPLSGILSKRDIDKMTRLLKTTSP